MAAAKNQLSTTASVLGKESIAITRIPPNIWRSGHRALQAGHSQTVGAKGDN